MKEEEGAFICERGRMPTSLDLARRLREYTATATTPRGTSSRSQLGGTWFCPACASRLEELQHCFTCSNCNRHLDKFVIYVLIELHPHWSEKQG
jgi:hypothetical protein